MTESTHLANRTASAVTTGAILYADLVESVRLNRTEEAESVPRWMAFEAEVRGRITPVHGGRLIKSTGDGFLIVFTAVDHAVAAAFGMQLTLAREKVSPEHRFHLRVGINWGSFADAGFDIFGEDIDRAQRISAVAMPDEIILSENARSRLAPTSPAQIDTLGPRKLKHIDELVPIFRATPPGQNRPQRPATQFRPLSPSIAIADITASGSGASPELAAQIADDLRRTLSRTVGLSVASRIDALLSAREKVPYVVSGSIAAGRTPGQVDVTLELASTRSGALIWQDRFCTDRESLEDPEAPAIIPVAADISRHLVEAERSAARGRPFDALESHTLLVSAIALMNGLTPAGFDCARSALETLAETSGRHPTPLAWLAQWYVMRRLQNWSRDPATDHLTARDLTSRALHAAANPDQAAHARISHGLVLAHLAGDAPAALSAFGAALSLAPTDGTALAASALTLACLGEGDAARDSALRALSLSPLDPQLYQFQTSAAFAFLASGAHDAAFDMAEAAAMNNPNFRPARLAMALAAAELGEIRTARAAASLTGTQGPLGALAALPAANGPMVLAWRRALEPVLDASVHEMPRAG